MKLPSIKEPSSKRLALAIACATLLVSACSQQQQSAHTEDSSGTESQPSAVAEDSEPLQESDQEVGSETRAEQDPPVELTESQALIRQTKALLTEKKYAEARDFLDELSQLPLTPEEQAWASRAKSHIEAATARE